MFIGHLPTGYIASSLAHDHWPFFANVKRRYLLACGLVGSIFPDCDLLYFFLFDHRSQHHHHYWTHLPAFWLLSLFCVGCLLTLTKKTIALACVAIFGINVFLHLILDSIVGDIWWLYPWVNKPFAFFTVPAIYHPWWLNFILHWSFLLEITLTTIAIYMLNIEKYRIIICSKGDFNRLIFKADESAPTRLPLRLNNLFQRQKQIRLLITRPITTNRP